MTAQECKSTGGTTYLLSGKTKLTFERARAERAPLIASRLTDQVNNRGSHQFTLMVSMPARVCTTNREE
jgi:hypothetical protein